LRKDFANILLEQVFNFSLLTKRTIFFASSYLVEREKTHKTGRRRIQEFSFQAFGVITAISPVLEDFDIHFFFREVYGIGASLTRKKLHSVG
jgi:hypothetical protein